MESNREEFLWKLRVNLRDISEEEREEAISYYTNYFEEAGPENEKKVMEELKSPEELARAIISDLQTEKRDTVSKPIVNMTSPTNEVPQESVNYTQEFINRKKTERESIACEREDRAHDNKSRKSSKGSVNTWLIICIILLSPIWAGLLLGLIGLIVGLALGAIGLFIAAVLTCIALIAAFIISGVAVIVKAVLMAATTPFIAGFLLCLSIVLIVLGVLFAKLFSKLLRFFLPWIIRGTVRMIMGAVSAVTGFFKGIEENR